MSKKVFLISLGDNVKPTFESEFDVSRKYGTVKQEHTCVTILLPCSFPAASLLPYLAYSWLVLGLNRFFFHFCLDAVSHIKFLSYDLNSKSLL